MPERPQELGGLAPIGRRSGRSRRAVAVGGHLVDPLGELGQRDQRRARAPGTPPTRRGCGRRPAAAPGSPGWASSCDVDLGDGAWPDTTATGRPGGRSRRAASASGEGVGAASRLGPQAHRRPPRRSAPARRRTSAPRRRRRPASGAERPACEPMGSGRSTTGTATSAPDRPPAASAAKASGSGREQVAGGRRRRPSPSAHAQRGEQRRRAGPSPGAGRRRRPAADAGPMQATSRRRRPGSAAATRSAMAPPSIDQVALSRPMRRLAPPVSTAPTATGQPHGASGGGQVGSSWRRNSAQRSCSSASPMAPPSTASPCSARRNPRLVSWAQRT